MCSPQIAILLATYNGEKFLAEQLNSIEVQTYSNWTVYASDDFSCDSTVQILQDYQAKWGKEKLVIFRGSCRGYVQNFLFLAKIANGKYDFYAFCDQDDVWRANKLERAISFLHRHSELDVALYCSRTTYIDVDGNRIGASCLFKRRPSFENALVQSIAGGNTMVFTKAACDIFRELPLNIKVVSHDWLLYILVTAVGGKVYFDSYESVFYRQHPNSLIGQNRSFSAVLKRVRQLLSGRYRLWVGENLNVLLLFFSRFNSENQRIYKCLLNARELGLIGRIIFFKKSRIYRQTFNGNIALFIAATIKKL